MITNFCPLKLTSAKICSTKALEISKIKILSAKRSKLQLKHCSYLGFKTETSYLPFSSHSADKLLKALFVIYICSVRTN